MFPPSNTTDIASHLRFAAKTTYTNFDEVAWEIMREQFGSEAAVFAIDGNTRNKIHAAIVMGLAKGQMLALTPINETTIQKLMREDAEEFEKTLAVGVNISKRHHPSYSWGWTYVDPAVQAQFKAFCNRHKTG